MIYIFSSLIVLAGGGILGIVWKYYGGEIRRQVSKFWENRSLPRISVPRFLVREDKSKSIISNYKPKIALPKASLVVAKFKKEKRGTLSAKTKGVHVSSLVSKESSVKKKEPARGEQFWIEVIKSDPHNPHPYKKLGEWYTKNGQAEYALQTFEHAARLDPDDNEIVVYIENLREEA